MPSQTRTSPMNVFSTGATQANLGQSPVSVQSPYASQNYGQRESGYGSERLGGMGQLSQPAPPPQNQYQQLYEYKQQQRAQQLRELEAQRERELERELALQQAQRDQRERLQLAQQRELQLREQQQQQQQEMRMRAQYQSNAEYEREQQRREQARQYYEYQQRLMQQQSQQQVQLQQQQHLLSQQQQQQQQQSQQQTLLSQFQQPQGVFSSNSQMDSSPYDRIAMRSGEGQRDRSLPRHSQYEHLPTPPASLPQRPPGMLGQPFTGSGPAPTKPLTPGSMYQDQALPTQQTGLPMRPPQGLSPQSQYPPNLPIQQSGAQFNNYPSTGVLGHSRSGTAASMSGFQASSGAATTPGGMTPGGMAYQQQQQLQAQQQRQTQQQLLLSQFQGGMRGGFGSGPGVPLTSPPIQQQHSQGMLGPSGSQQLPPHMLSGRLPPQF
ncbi:hypothetical protein CALCODRAFT_315632 [Calocera cornea HHB12733]|uniref:Uncharacterized protein n=1 Tax=Calocera cornea HHB12733 TaxID=1353952 RepID=A0A165F9N8_9BASI|nr:hypothetical protein CALCODRAFT_315632 [Calocera cornea HHB12733]